MSTNVIILNGGSSSGKTSIATRLQDMFPEPWLQLGIDTLIGMLPARFVSDGAGIDFQKGGQIVLSDQFTQLELCWMQGVAAVARAGAKIVVTDSFISGTIAQKRWRDALHGINVLWVGVHCRADVATQRELLRGDRQRGMAAQQAELVHQGIDYDVTVDSTKETAFDCAQRIQLRIHPQIP
jgi:chloramphenicol 3-O phosphotransferase